MRVRLPNCGPYVVAYRCSRRGAQVVECHTWVEACRVMRGLLIDGAVITGVSYV